MRYIAFSRRQNEIAVMKAKEHQLMKVVTLEIFSVSYLSFC